MGKSRAEYFRVYRKQHPELTLKRYGMTLAEYRALMERQGGVCAICGEENLLIRHGAFGRLVVDHDHDSGKVRGLLCDRCNRLIGVVELNRDRIAAVIEYLMPAPPGGSPGGPNCRSASW